MGGPAPLEPLSHSFSGLHQGEKFLLRFLCRLHSGCIMLLHQRLDRCSGIGLGKKKNEKKNSPLRLSCCCWVRLLHSPPPPTLSAAGWEFASDTLRVCLRPLKYVYDGRKEE